MRQNNIFISIDVFYIQAIPISCHLHSNSIIKQHSKNSTSCQLLLKLYRQVIIFNHFDIVNRVDFKFKKKLDRRKDLRLDQLVKTIMRYWRRQTSIKQSQSDFSKTTHVLAINVQHLVVFVWQPYFPGVKRRINVETIVKFFNSSRF